MRLSLLAAFAIVAVASSAVASSSYARSELLVGWSADGKTWATIDSESSSDTELLSVHTLGAESVSFCDGEGEQECEAKRRLGIEAHRADIKGHELLRDYKLQRPKSSARAAFKILFRLEGKKLGLQDPQNCTKNFDLIPKFPISRKTITTDNCIARLVGGYYHPAGNHVLVKIKEAWDSSDDVERSDTEQDSFVLIEL